MSDEPTCWFCEKHQSDVQLLIDKGGICICDECVLQFSDFLTHLEAGEPTEPYKDCSFCSFMRLIPTQMHPTSKEEENEKFGYRLIRGDRCSICDECIELCVEILESQGIEV